MIYLGVLRGEKSRFQLFGDTMNTGELQPDGSLLKQFSDMNLTRSDGFVVYQPHAWNRLERKGECNCLKKLPLC